MPASETSMVPASQEPPASAGPLPELPDAGHTLEPLAPVETPEVVVPPVLPVLFAPVELPEPPALAGAPEAAIPPPAGPPELVPAPPFDPELAPLPPPDDEPPGQTCEATCAATHRPPHHTVSVPQYCAPDPGGPLEDVEPPQPASAKKDKATPSRTHPIRTCPRGTER